MTTTAADGQRIAGYYTLASASLLLTDLPEIAGKKLPRYPTMATVGTGRLAIDHKFKRQDKVLAARYWPMRSTAQLVPRLLLLF